MLTAGIVGCPLPHALWPRLFCCVDFCFSAHFSGFLVMACEWVSEWVRMCAYIFLFVINWFFFFVQKIKKIQNVPHQAKLFSGNLLEFCWLFCFHCGNEELAPHWIVLRWGYCVADLRKYIKTKTKISFGLYLCCYCYY